MSVVINTNSAATIASNNLSASNESLQKSLNRLSSGSRIVTPSDDAGGLAVSMKLSAAARRSGAASNNVANAVSFLQSQDGVLKVVGKILERMSELSTLYSDATKTSTDQANYTAEFTALQTEITLLADEKFNGITLSGSIAVKTTEAGGGSVSTTAVTMPSSLPFSVTRTSPMSCWRMARAASAMEALQSNRMGFALMTSRTVFFMGSSNSARAGHDGSPMVGTYARVVGRQPDARNKSQLPRPEPSVTVSTSATPRGRPEGARRTACRWAPPAAGLPAAQPGTRR